MQSHVAHQYYQQLDKELCITFFSFYYFFSYSDEQRAKGRFTSPCLSIYTVHMGSVSSGAHRLTGMGLVGGIFTHFLIYLIM